MLEQDAGRPLSHISHNLIDLEIVELAGKVIKTLSPIEQEVQSRNGQWYILKITPYITHANTVDGVVITLVDITERKQIEDSLKEREAQLRSMFETAAIGISWIDVSGQFLDANPSFQDMVGYSLQELSRLTLQILPTRMRFNLVPTPLMPC